MRRFLTNLLRDQDAATAVEYAVMLALILIAILGTIGVVGGRSGGMWGDIGSNLSTAGLGGS